MLMSVSPCQPFDELVTCRGFTVPSPSVSWDKALAPPVTPSKDLVVENRWMDITDGD